MSIAATPYDPKLFVDGYSALGSSPFFETAFSTDAATIALQTAMGFSETDFSTDTATFERFLGFCLAEDDWVTNLTVGYSNNPWATYGLSTDEDVTPENTGMGWDETAFDADLTASQADGIGFWLAEDTW